MQTGLTGDDVQLLADAVPMGLFLLGANSSLLWANERLYEIFGIDASADDQPSWLDTVHPDDLADTEAAIARLRVKGKADINLRVTTPEGLRWIRLVINRADPAVLASGGQVHFAGVVEDVTSLHSLRNQLEQEATTDALTGLPNRTRMLAHLESVLDEHVDQPLHVAVLFIDLDGFKLINDTKGHSVGDALLRVVADRLASTLRPGDMVARFGGDEFVVVASNVPDADIATRVADRLHATLATPIIVADEPLSTGASIGVALSDNSPATPDDLLGDADLAMYEAKNHGRGCTRVYHPSLRRAASQRFDITNDLKHARTRHELRLEYQPIINLTTGAMVGAEALLRWHHPVWGRMRPDAFVPIAVESGLIGELGNWVIWQACADLARLRATDVAGADFFMNINVSARQFHPADGLVETAMASVNRHGLDPSDLLLELTEPVADDSMDAAGATAAALRENGFRISLDHFGAAETTLERLTNLPFDAMKIDPAFLQRAGRSDASRALVESLLFMANRLEFTMIATGVESPHQIADVSGAGIELAQGWFFSRPVPIDALSRIGAAIDQTVVNL